MRGALRFLRDTRISRWHQVDAPTIYGRVTDPTKPTTVVQDVLYWRRMGSYMQVRYHFAAVDATGAAAGSGVYSIDVPDGQSIDQNKITPFLSITANLSQQSSSVGYAAGEGDDGVGVEPMHGKVWVYELSGNNRISWSMGYGSVNSVHLREVSDLRAPLNIVPVRYNLMAFIPIQGWGETQ